MDRMSWRSAFKFLLSELCNLSEILIRLMNNRRSEFLSPFCVIVAQWPILHLYKPCFMFAMSNTLPTFLFSHLIYYNLQLMLIVSNVRQRYPMWFQLTSEMETWWLFKRHTNLFFLYQLYQNSTFFLSLHSSSLFLRYLFFIQPCILYPTLSLYFRCTTFNRFNIAM